MKIVLKLNKSINDNANIYYEKAKKLKSKIKGIDNIISKTKKEIEEFENKKQEYLKKKETDNKINLYRKKEWYEKFRWTKTSNGFLVVIGKDSGTNEILIKKHLEDDDLVMHTESQGSPFGLIKNAKNKISEEEIEEALQFVCCFSKQWIKGYGSSDAFWVFPKQVSKKAQSGEYISRGSFMIRGKKNIIKNIQIRICLGVAERKIKTPDGEMQTQELFSGSEKACIKLCGNRYIKLEPGNSNYKALNKEIKKKLKTQTEDLPKYIPNNCKILKK